jgi:cell division protein ZapA
MDGSAPEKKPVRLTIFNQTFTLLVDGDPDELLRAANEVDELMSTISRSGNMDAVRVAILACLHLQDRVDSLREEVEKLRGIETRTRELARLLDEAMPHN